MQNTIIFAAAFLFGLLCYRVLFLLNKQYFHKPFTRTKTGLSVHHLHFGIIFALIGTLVLLADSDKNYFVYGFLGLGFGLIFDLFIGSLLMKGDRPKELEIYKNTFPHTLILGAAIIGVAFLVTILV